MICFEPFHFTKLDTGTFSGKSALEVSGQPYACEAGEQLIPMYARTNRPRPSPVCYL